MVEKKKKKKKAARLCKFAFGSLGLQGLNFASERDRAARLTCAIGLCLR